MNIDGAESEVSAKTVPLGDKPGTSTKKGKKEGGGAAEGGAAEGTATTDGV